jgi:hypothetical protein
MNVTSDHPLHSYIHNIMEFDAWVAAEPCIKESVYLSAENNLRRDVSTDMEKRCDASELRTSHPLSSATVQVLQRRPSSSSSDLYSDGSDGWRDPRHTCRSSRRSFVADKSPVASSSSDDDERQPSPRDEDIISKLSDLTDASAAEQRRRRDDVVKLAELQARVASAENSFGQLNDVVATLSHLVASLQVQVAPAQASIPLRDLPAVSSGQDRAGSSNKSKPPPYMSSTSVVDEKQNLQLFPSHPAENESDYKGDARQQIDTGDNLAMCVPTDNAGGTTIKGPEQPSALWTYIPPTGGTSPASGLGFSSSESAPILSNKVCLPDYVRTNTLAVVSSAAGELPAPSQGSASSSDGCSGLFLFEAEIYKQYPIVKDVMTDPGYDMSEVIKRFVQAAAPYVVPLYHGVPSEVLDNSIYSTLCAFPYVPATGIGCCQGILREQQNEYYKVVLASQIPAVRTAMLDSLIDLERLDSGALPDIAAPLQSCLRVAEQMQVDTLDNEYDQDRLGAVLSPRRDGGGAYLG